MTYQARAKLLRSASLVIERVNDLSDSRFLVHAIASRLAVASCEGWLASAEALYERQIKREANHSPYFILPARENFRSLTPDFLVTSE
jgi:hypothetical protein